jgi:hypothetical protein
VVTGALQSRIAPDEMAGARVSVLGVPLMKLSTPRLDLIAATPESLRAELELFAREGAVLAGGGGEDAHVT